MKGYWCLFALLLSIQSAHALIIINNTDTQRYIDLTDCIYDYTKAAPSSCKKTIPLLTKRTIGAHKIAKTKPFLLDQAGLSIYWGAKTKYYAGPQLRVVETDPEKVKTWKSIGRKKLEASRAHSTLIEYAIPEGVATLDNPTNTPYRKIGIRHIICKKIENNLDKARDEWMNLGTDRTIKNAYQTENDVYIVIPKTWEIDVDTITETASIKSPDNVHDYIVPGKIQPDGTLIPGNKILKKIIPFRQIDGRIFSCNIKTKQQIVEETAEEKSTFEHQAFIALSPKDATPLNTDKAPAVIGRNHIILLTDAFDSENPNQPSQFGVKTSLLYLPSAAEMKSNEIKKILIEKGILQEALKTQIPSPADKTIRNTENSESIKN